MSSNKIRSYKKWIILLVLPPILFVASLGFRAAIHFTYKPQLITNCNTIGGPICADGPAYTSPNMWLQNPEKWLDYIGIVLLVIGTPIWLCLLLIDFIQNKKLHKA
jgi:hypothetical protein